MQCVLGEHHEVDRAHAPFGLAGHGDDFSVCAAMSARVAISGSFSCTRPMTTPFGDLFSPPKPFTGASFRLWIDRLRCKNDAR